MSGDERCEQDPRAADRARARDRGRSGARARARARGRVARTVGASSSAGRRSRTSCSCWRPSRSRRPASSSACSARSSLPRRRDARCGAGSRSSLAVTAAAAITAGGMLLGFRDDRRLADHYRSTLGVAHGTYFGAVRLADPAGREGGDLSLLLPRLPVLDPDHGRAAVPCVGRAGRVIERGGARNPLAAFRLANGSWGGSIPIDLRDVAAVHLVGADGRSVLVAEL